MDHVLEFATVEIVDQDLWLFQVEDGTIFHWKYVLPHRLYVKSKGIKFDADLPDEDLLCNGVHANAIYFSSPQKIYRAVYTTNNGIEVDFMRLKQEDEGWHEGSIYSTEREGRTHIVRMFDVSDSDGLPFDVTDETLIVPKLMYVHRDKVIYVSEEPGTSQPSMHRMSETVVRVDLPFDIETTPHYSLHARDSSAFLYISNQEFLYAFNMETMTALPVLQTSGLSIYYIVGAHKGVLTIVGVRDGECFLMTATLPKDYVSCRSFRFDSSLSVPAETPDSAISNGNSSTQTAMNQINEIDEYMHKTISDLRKRNSELKEENERLKRGHEEEKRELNSVIVDLRTKNAQLEQENNRLQKNNNEENDEMITELRKIISVLSVDCEKEEELDRVNNSLNV